jgi:uncharacterized protein (UPF0333 family)
MFILLNNRRKKGQSTLEYAILIIIVMAALLSIQVYIKRGIQGRMKQAADDIGDQFSPQNTSVTITRRTQAVSNDTFAAGVTTSTLGAGGEVTTENGTSAVINNEQEFWGN